MPRAQRAAALRMMASAFESLDEAERKNFVDAHVRESLEMTREQIFTNLIAAADQAGEATLAFVANARLGDVEGSRGELRKLAKALLRAAQLDAYPGSDRISKTLRFPGAHRIARRGMSQSRLYVFWSRLGKTLHREAEFAGVGIENVGELTRLLAREVRGVSLEQVCRGALVYEGPS